MPLEIAWSHPNMIYCTKPQILKPVLMHSNGTLKVNSKIIPRIIFTSFLYDRKIVIKTFTTKTELREGNIYVGWRRSCVCWSVFDNFIGREMKYLSFSLKSHEALIHFLMWIKRESRNFLIFSKKKLFFFGVYIR